MAVMENRDIIAKIIAKLKALEGEIGGVDVQINGTSIVHNGVANIEYASTSKYGLIKVGSGLTIDTTTKALRLVPASDENIRVQSSVYSPIGANKIGIATFFGLATASGDTTQKESSNAIGIYTDTAIDKILIMLGMDSLIAPHETETAANAYSIGDYFIFNGKLCKATDAIAIDDTIAIGTNCTTTTIMAEIATVAAAVAGGGT